MAYKDFEKIREYYEKHNHEYYCKNKERILIRKHNYYAKNKERINAYNREYYAKTNDQRYAYRRKYFATHRDLLNANARKRRANIRMRILEIYGRQCACGEKDERFLTLAHKNNDGAQDRRENGGWAGVLLRAIKEPDHIQYGVQCYKCQHIAHLDYLSKKTFKDNSGMGQKRRARNRARDKKMRQRMFEIYGCSCVCCGEIDQRVLQLAHKNNDGGEDRRKNGQAVGVLKRAVEHPDHTKYEILCANCNQGANANGGVCPHKNPM